MKIQLLFFFSLLAVSLTGLNGQVPEWQMYKDSSANFSILFPKGKIMERTDTVNAPVGELRYNTYLFNNESEKGISVFMLSMVDYPPESIHHDSTDLLTAFFQNTVEAAAESVFGEIVYQESATVRGYPGMIWRIHYNEGEAVIQTRAFVVNNTYYSLQIVAARAYGLSPEAEKFFDSFRFLRSPE